MTREPIDGHDHDGRPSPAAPGPVAAARRSRRRTSRKTRNKVLVAVTAVVVVAINGPVAASAGGRAVEAYRTSRPAYTATHGSWRTVSLPEQYRARAMHAALLHNGKVLLVAGSGNSQAQFDAGTFSTVLWDPATGAARSIPTPEDLFCGGHAYLPDGDLLIAGGTREYEVLAGDVTRAAGVMTVKNESADTGEVRLPRGTRFTSAGGHAYVSTEEVVVAPAHRMGDGSLMASTRDVWVQAEEEGEAPVVTGGAQYDLTGLAPEVSRYVYGVSDGLTLDKQNYRGLDASYVFDVATERYVETGRLEESRWYPTLVSRDGGDVLAVSGLDEYGRVLDGDTEVFSAQDGTWSRAPELDQYFPTYPHLFRLADGRIFYSGANTGYGPAEEGRQSGIWDLSTNSFQDVGGLRDADMNETATSFLLPPVQEQRVAVVGGGAVGDAPGSTNRFDVVDLDAGAAPGWQPGPDYPADVRYLNAVTLPDDTVLLTGGSTGYRGKGDSDLHLSRIYDPAAGTLTEAAPNRIGRNYHGTALLLPDGRVMTMGSDPLFSDADDTLPGQFETRIEIYTPPYLHTGTERPTVTAITPAGAPRAVFPVPSSSGSETSSAGAGTTGVVDALRDTVDANSSSTGNTGHAGHAAEESAQPAPESVDPPAPRPVLQRGSTSHVEAGVREGGSIVSARLLRPSAVTHQTDTEQRSVALGLTPTTGADGAVDGYDLHLEGAEGITPDGPYLLVLLDDRGVPSVGQWVQVR
ncbi:galactose oxidase-like domain-containing protein [Kineococcus sp. SYSU DK006]|uniref:galactose oxidase-like domain-containing protein n=1 Tax=Kineococcus sp. SYSU DK006 TaxID=3383127 RepID=UPI003D7E5851